MGTLQGPMPSIDCVGCDRLRGMLCNSSIKTFTAISRRGRFPKNRTLLSRDVSADIVRRCCNYSLFT